LENQGFLASLSYFPKFLLSNILENSKLIEKLDIVVFCLINSLLADSLIIFLVHAGENTV